MTISHRSYILLLHLCFVLVKADRDIGGIDSIFSATVGNNVLVRMATLTERNKPAGRRKRKKKLSGDFQSSADILARNLNSPGSGGPISKPLIFKTLGYKVIFSNRNY